MQVKVFESEDIKSTLRKVKETLGPDALILSTRTVRKRGKGLLSKQVVEVTAAIDNDVDKGSAPRVPQESTSIHSDSENIRTIDDNLTYEQLWRNRKVIDPLEEEVKELRQSVETLDFDKFQDEIKELKGLFNNAMEEISSHQKPDIKIVDDFTSYKDVQSSNITDSNWLASGFDELAAYGIRGRAAENLMRSAAKKLSIQQVADKKTLKTFFNNEISRQFKVSGPIKVSSKESKRLALIGPTGVGKTTTVAKLAASYLKHFDKNVALVTIDTYRIAAVEQLKVYGEIMNLPVEVVISPDQMENVLNKHDDKKLILIDTAGRSPRDEMSIKELSSFLRPEFGIENHLVLSATNSEDNLENSVNRFSILPVHNIVFSKIDECATLGNLLSVNNNNEYPISYLTNGQKVPEDLMLANPKKISDLIMGKRHG